MTAYATAAALRQAIEERLRHRSETTGESLDRLRRRLVFERLLVRLQESQPGSWILKGGMALELRLGDRARATKDLDLALRESEPTEELVLTKLAQAIQIEVDQDRFEFEIRGIRSMAPHVSPDTVWRVNLLAKLAGREFGSIRADIVTRTDEIASTETFLPTPTLDIPELQTREVEIVDPKQHFAEKLHAVTRSFANRPNTRSRDLVDLVLLIENGLRADQRLAKTLAHVFDHRGTHSLEGPLPELPESWRPEFDRAVRDLQLGPKSLDEAVELVETFLSRTFSNPEG